VAQSLCDAKLVSVNQRPARSAHAVKPGDEISIHRGNRQTTVKVLLVPEAKQTSRSAAATLYELLDEVVDREEL
jgi:ribosomal 50S subunit-recycling heat shock protein